MSTATEDALDVLTNLKKDLDRQIKERESRLRAVEGEVGLAVLQYQKELAVIHTQFQKTKAEALKMDEVYRSNTETLNDRAVAARKELAFIEARRTEEIAAIRHERHFFLDTINNQITKRHRVLAKANAEIATVKQRVLEL